MSTASRPRHLSWLAAGVAVGLAAAYVVWSTGGGFFTDHRDGVWRPGMSLAQFEMCLRLSRIPSAPPKFRDLLIYPAAPGDGSIYVSGAYVPDLASPGRYRPFEMCLTRDQAHDIEARNLQTFLVNNYPRVSFRYAWWASPVVPAGVALLASVFLIGLAFPVALRRLPARRPSESRTGGAEKPFPASTPADEVPPAPAVLRPVEPMPITVPALTSDATPIRSVPAFAPEKHYRGEFYPVARPPHAPAGHG